MGDPVAACYPFWRNAHARYKRNNILGRWESGLLRVDATYIGGAVLIVPPTCAIETYADDRPRRPHRRSLMEAAPDARAQHSFADR